eukprot:TRINITY_DN7715_c0_g1_i1.p1 TRINITY_DN7715_c0_g1~~TRINITY_DN7715_c0_g1_i1.p1  ORF type:complete len:539 (+),score=119.58 TRINITY_DN7715_c0_g1_i1:48-1664(+)
MSLTNRSSSEPDLANQSRNHNSKGTKSKKNKKKPVRNNVNTIDTFTPRNPGQKPISDVKTIVANSNILLPFEPGYIEPDDNEFIYKITQDQIVNAVDIQTSEKVFDLDLNTFGPYTIDYSRNGKYLLLAGEKGHVALIDWVKKELLSEVQFKETIYDIKFLHSHQMFAVAQKKSTFVYDEHGVELHRLPFNHPKYLDYLPYHFLLVLANEDGELSYLDSSLGEKVVTHNAKTRVHCLAQNPNNAVMMMGQGNGCVTMWAPNSSKPLVKMFCHKSPVRCVTVNSTGQYLVTAGLDNYTRVWDLRNTYKHLLTFETAATAKSIAVSQRGMLGISFHDSIHFWKNMGLDGADKSQYIRHNLGTGRVRDIAFCPFEDVLGIGHSAGFSSVLVPGSGEPNFDTSEVNPFQTKSQRRNAEVKMLLDKIPADMILLDPTAIGKVAPEPEEKESDLTARAIKDTLTSRKKKSLGKTPGRAVSNLSRIVVDRRRTALQEQMNKEFIKEIQKKKKNSETKKKRKKVAETVEEEIGEFDPLARFKKQKK